MEQEKIKQSDAKYHELSKDNFVELGWNDPEKRDDLVIVSSKPFKEVMEANAKGTRVYELIDMYGGVDNVSKVFPGTNSMYGDCTDMPETFSPEQLENMAAKMSAYAKALKEQEGTNNPEGDPAPKGDEKGKTGEDGSNPEPEVK